MRLRFTVLDNHKEVETVPVTAVNADYAVACLGMSRVLMAVSLWIITRNSLICTRLERQAKWA